MCACETVLYMYVGDCVCARTCVSRSVHMCQVTCVHAHMCLCMCVSHCMVSHFKNSKYICEADFQKYSHSKISSFTAVCTRMSRAVGSIAARAAMAATLFEQDL